MNTKLNENMAHEIAKLFHEMMMMIGRASDGDMVRLITKLDLTLPQLISLDLMYLRPQTVSSLSTELRLTTGAVSRLVDSLVHKKLVSREEGIDDRRRKILKLTESGRCTVDQLERARNGNIAKVASTFDPALGEDFKAVLERVIAVLRSYALTQQKVVHRNGRKQAKNQENKIGEEPL